MFHFFIAKRTLNANCQTGLLINSRNFDQHPSILILPPYDMQMLDDLSGVSGERETVPAAVRQEARYTLDSWHGRHTETSIHSHNNIPRRFIQQLCPPHPCLRLWGNSRESQTPDVSGRIKQFKSFCFVLFFPAPCSTPAALDRITKLLTQTDSQRNHASFSSAHKVPCLSSPCLSRSSQSN